MSPHIATLAFDFAITKHRYKNRSPNTLFIAPNWSIRPKFVYGAKFVYSAKIACYSKIIHFRVETTQAQSYINDILTALIGATCA
jgi:hypothetical protein